MPQPTATPTTLLVVANAGTAADYTAEPRHLVELDLPFTPSGRSSAAQIRTALRRAWGRVDEYLSPRRPGEETATGDLHTDLLVWALDGAGRPAVFLTGLLAVRAGRATKAEADALHRRLLPQVTAAQPAVEARLLVGAAVQKWGGYLEPAGDEDELADRENELLDELDGEFDSFDLGDTEEDEDGTLYVQAVGWMAVTVRLPAPLGPKATGTRLRHATAAALAGIGAGLPDDWEVDHDHWTEVWALDGAGDPRVYVSGLLDVAEGRLPRLKLKAETERAKADLPRLARPLARAG